MIKVLPVIVMVIVIIGYLMFLWGIVWHLHGDISILRTVIVATAGIIHMLRLKGKYTAKSTFHPNSITPSLVHSRLNILINQNKLIR